MLYRNWPRDFHYQMFANRIPRGSSCFVCRRNTLTGLDHLPSGGHIVAAPYATATESAEPHGGLGTPLVNGSIDPEIGLDVKWTPNGDNVVDFTANPDFSQVESDTAQITANERFALFSPEKRPFFLEGVDLFSTPNSGGVLANDHGPARRRTRHGQDRRHALHRARDRR